MAVAPQRIDLLTRDQVLNTVRYLIDDQEAKNLLASGVFAIVADPEKHFPPADVEEAEINDTSVLPRYGLATHVAGYVSSNFAAVSRCVPATDACATAYLTALAARAYRRQPTADEQQRLIGLYTAVRSQVVNAQAVMTTVEEATGYAVQALLMSPQLVWRWEIGGAQAVGAPGVSLTGDELASALSFFLTDAPPDQPLLDAARAGTLTLDTIGPQADRLLGTPAARVWLSKVMEVYFQFNQLPTRVIDPDKYPFATNQLIDNMQTEARMFLDFALWTGPLAELLTSRTAFLNTTLATDIYKVPVPAGATATVFVQTTLPAGERGGLLTNAAFLTVGRTSGVGIHDLPDQGKRVNNLMIGYVVDGVHSEDIGARVWAQVDLFDAQTPSQQVAYRASMPGCATCHQHFDPYGLALNAYDRIGRFRTVDERGAPADARATLPPELGGETVNGAVELRQVMARNPAFIDQLATSLLQYAMIRLEPRVERPSMPGEAPRAACAVNDLTQRFRGRPTQTFAALLRDVATSPAFGYRRPTP